MESSKRQQPAPITTNSRYPRAFAQDNGDATMIEIELRSPMMCAMCGTDALRSHRGCSVRCYYFMAAIYPEIDEHWEMP